MYKQLFMVFVGGGLGSLLRFLFSIWINTDQIKWIPTMVVNILGCLLLGTFLSMSQKNLLDNNLYVLLGIGFCGGLTTFSTLSADLFHLFKSGNYLQAFLYLAITLISGITALYIGYQLTKQYL